MDSSNTPPQPNFPSNLSPEPKKSRWPLSRKMTIIIGAILLLVVICIVAVTILTKKKTAQTTDKSDTSSIYYKRAGYESDGDGIGDPAALVSESTSKVVQYDGQTILQPCSLVTIADLQGMGLQLLQNQLTGPVESMSFDGQSNVTLPSATASVLPVDGNHCQYFLKDLERVTVTAYQSSYASVKVLNEQMAKYQPLSDVNGVKVYQRVRNESPKLGLYLLREGDTALELYIDMENAETKDKVVKLAAKRLKEAASIPSPMQKFTYKSPIFTGSAINSCETLSANAFRKVLGVDPSPMVDEKFGSAVGVIQLGNSLFNYISYECSRESVVKFPDQPSSLRMVATTYESEEAAKQAMSSDRDGAGTTQNLQEITPAIGDDSFYADVAGMDKAIQFRKGRVTVRVAVNTGKNNTSVTPEARIKMLTPILNEAVMGPLKEY